MEFLPDLLDRTEAPVLYALLLGLLTAISPCQFARNITAVGYISRDIQNTGKVFVNGLFYTLGNATGYLALGVILSLGASKFDISRVLVSGGNLVMGLLLLTVGLVMLDVIKFRATSGGWILRKAEAMKDRGSKFDSAVLGLLFALSFCPYNAALFFGMLIPLTVASTAGLVLPVVYSFAAGLPVIIVAWLIAFSVAGIGSFYNKVRVFQVWLNRIVAIVFLLTGAYFIYMFLVQRFSV